MKRIISSLLVATLAMSAGVAKAENLRVEEAGEAAAYFMSCYTGSDKIADIPATLVYQMDNERLGIPATYFFNLAEGWVVMAATTAVDPILAYSDEGSLEVGQLPDNMMWYMQQLADKVSEVQELDAEMGLLDSPTWTALKSRTFKGQTKADQVILLQARWGQGDENSPTFNLFCPKDANGRTSVTGCVATAMSQIMFYYQYPKKTTGGVRRYTLYANGTMPQMDMVLNYDTVAVFDYSNMPNRPTDAYNRQLCTNDQMREVARLNYAAGVSVMMNYSPDGSGTQSSKVPNAMKKYFKYRDSRLITRGSASNWNFVHRMRESLERKNVLYMSGSSSIEDPNDRDAAGHAWVCAGYMSSDTNMYYMNWGWSGSGNGFAALGLNVMKPDGYERQYNFNVGLAFIEGMNPPADSNRFGVGIVDVDATELGAAYPNPAVSEVVLPFSTEVASDLVVYSIEGKPVATQRVLPGMGEVVLRVDGLAAGIYIYRLNSRSGKFVVQ